MNSRIAPVAPGELLKEEFLEPMGITWCRLAKEIGIPAQHIGQIVLGKQRMTADVDLRLCKFFGLADGYWLRAQVTCDIDAAKRELVTELAKVRPWSASVL